MPSEEDKKRFPKPKPDDSPLKRAKMIADHEAIVAPLREKRVKRTREGGSWLLVGGKLVPNEDDPRKGKPVDEPVSKVEPLEKVETPIILKKEAEIVEAGREEEIEE